MLLDSRQLGNLHKPINLIFNRHIMINPDNIAYIRQETDYCVKCGLCLPDCPTYVKTRDEGDSPRGRISLMQGLVDDRLQLTGRLEFHLDRCLTCRACEDVCPSNVHYGQLIDAARELIRHRHRPTTTRRVLHRLLVDPLLFNRALLRTAARTMRLYQLSGLRWLLRKSGALKVLGLQRLERILPDIGSQATWSSYYPACGKETGRVALFTGCIGSIIDRAAIDAAIKLLRHCGYAVHVPASQSCCGALHRHGGMAEQANELARRNLVTFNGLDISAVLYTASGCGVTLSEYPLYVAKQGFNMPVMDVSQFLCGIDWPAYITFKRLDANVLVHDPCSLRHVLHQQQGPYTLLWKIPGLKVAPLPDNDRCCGAAGSYMLSQPAMADSLRDDKVREIARLKPAYLVTSNIGCALHLTTGLRSQHPDIEILHPLTLLARQITTDT